MQHVNSSLRLSTLKMHCEAEPPPSVIFPLHERRTVAVPRLVAQYKRRNAERVEDFFCPCYKPVSKGKNAVIKQSA